MPSIFNVSHTHKGQQNAAWQFWHMVNLFTFTVVHLAKLSYFCSQIGWKTRGLINSLCRNTLVRLDHEGSYLWVWSWHCPTFGDSSWVFSWDIANFSAAAIGQPERLFENKVKRRNKKKKKNTLNEILIKWNILQNPMASNFSGAYSFIGTTAGISG